MLSCTMLNLWRKYWNTSLWRTQNCKLNKLDHPRRSGSLVLNCTENTLSCMILKLWKKYWKTSPWRTQNCTPSKLDHLHRSDIQESCCTENRVFWLSNETSTKSKVQCVSGWASFTIRPGRTARTLSVNCRTFNARVMSWISKRITLSAIMRVPDWAGKTPGGIACQAVCSMNICTRFALCWRYQDKTRWAWGARRSVSACYTVGYRWAWHARKICSKY